jgi:hypothetical protein
VTNPSDSTKAVRLPPCLHRATPRWSRERIRDARKAQLAPLIAKRGLALVEFPADNFGVTAFPGLIVKGSYWRWPGRDHATLSVKTVGLVA